MSEDTHQSKPGALTGEQLIALERERQISGEGWTANHDDDHDDGVMAAAAQCYVHSATGFLEAGEFPKGWPWEKEWWKPSSQVRDLVKAGALYLAEAARAYRLAQPEAEAKYQKAAAHCAEMIGRTAEMTGERRVPRLFYLEEANDKWCPVPFPNEEIPGIEDVENLEPGEERVIRLRRFDMTDAEVEGLPLD